MKASPFSRSAVVLLAALAVGLLALSMLLSAFDPSPTRSGNQSRLGSYSISALGSAGFYDTLKRLDRPVARSVSGPLGLVGAHGTLVMAEPDLGKFDDEDGAKILKAPRLLLVLPKWYGWPDENRPEWLEWVYPLPVNRALQTLALVTGEAEVIRRPWPADWELNEIGPRPSGSGQVQLIRSEKIRPVVGTSEGMLLGEIIEGRRKIWILADPDLMNNQGLVQGENVSFMLALVDELRGWNSRDPKAPLVFDETVHGYAEAGWSPFSLLFDFPMLVVTILLAVCAALLAAAGVGRFGAPAQAPPPLDFGKKQLIGNSARLLDYAGHQGLVLKRYILMSLRSVGRQLHAPAGLDDRALAEWLDHIGRARGLRSSCAEILRTAMGGFEDGSDQSRGRLFSGARAIYRWKGEMLDGSNSRRSHS